MRILLDTNVLIAAFITRGVCAEVFEHCVRHHTLVGSEFLVEEFRRSLVRKLRFSSADAEQAEGLLLSRLLLVEPRDVVEPRCRDRDDLLILGTASAGSCDLLVSGDRDLLDLKSFQGIPIVAPGDFWKREASGRRL